MDLKEQVAKTVFADKKVFDDSVWMDADLYLEESGHLTATVDGVVDFTALANAAIAAVLGAMREPSEGMLENGQELLLDFDGSGSAHQMAERAFAAMLTTFASEHNVEIGE